MYKYILQSVENINWLAVASLIIFFVIFVVSALWAFMSKKEFIDKMANLPLDNDEL
ncbi:MAG: CcoQ/FixQ family Cbb3-type cytochrome c oxidase assembly chaperone [Lewinellaceae bacterium]|nr:CcoQ/FixQ family Cbb3-type cytochrome c oxidase assembly chaperone [Saprospiraceae bacterium]MCB9339973.1 CcoQ/FixQ family Cbb3-type cytochrome c oxidase assembly chaperone [Lewinellaceae bacterium]